MSSVSSILGQEATTTQTTSKYEDKEMFLKLLVAQLSHQDPLNPVEDKEFIAQLAQFTQVEELQKMNTNMEGLVSAYDQQQLVSAVNLIGARVVSAGYTIAKVTDPTTKEPLANPFFYEFEDEVATCTVTITNPSTGQVMYSEQLGGKLPGEYTYSWSGKNSAGQPVTDGYYQVSVTATNVEGKKVLVNTSVYGDVIRVEKIDDEYYLTLADGRNVKYVDVTMVGAPTSSGGSSNENGNNGGNG